MEIDALCARSLGASRILFWKYSGRHRCVFFYGISCIERYFGKSEPIHSTTWKDFLLRLVHPDDRNRLDREFSRSLAESDAFHSSFRIKVHADSSWERMDVFAESSSEDVLTVDLGGIMRGEFPEISTETPKKISLPQIPSENPDDSTGNSTNDSADEVPSDIAHWLDSIPFCCLLWNTEGRLISCNDRAFQLFGASGREDFLRRFMELSPETQPNQDPSGLAVPEILAGVLHDGERTFEWLHRHIDGSLLPVEVSLVRFECDDRNYLVAYLKDLREIKKILNQTDEANERNRIMLDATPLCCNFWDESFNNIDCNQEAANLFDLSGKQEYLDKFDQLSPEYQPNGELSRDAAVGHIREAFRNGRTTFEWMHQKLDRTPIPSEITLVRVKRGNSYVVAGYTRDLRELKKTQAALDRERNLLRGILQTSPVCIAIVVGEEIRFATPFMTDFLGAQIGDQMGDFFAERECGIRLKKELDEHRRVDWRPVTLRTRSGEMKKMLSNFFHIDYYGEDGNLVWLIDVTEMCKVEADLRLARDAAEASAKTKSEFLANMSHEIRTPMNAILGMTHLALRTDLTAQQRKYLEGTEQSANILLRIINDILDFSKIEAGKMLMEYHEFFLDDILGDIEAIVSEPARQKNLILSFHHDESLTSGLMGDSVRLRQILVNLATNAIKFTESGSVDVDVRIAEQDELSVKLLFSVKDTGIGMTPGQIQALFRPFTQADTSTTRKYGGTGLGLAISKSIAEMMKGDIWCESRVDVGTTFWFTARFGWPLEDDGHAEEVRTDVLLCGDDHDTLKEIRNYLELLRCKTVAQCETLEEFDRFIESGRMGEVDFMIFDFNDTENLGRPVLSVLNKRFGEDSPSMFFVGNPELHHFLDEMQIPFPNRTISKPISAKDLFDLLVVVGDRKKERLQAVRKHHEKHEHGPDMSAKSYTIPDKIRGARILLAEDNRINQLVATELLTMEGFQVDVVENGRQAVDMVRQHPYELVLMDIQMPEMDGLEAARQIRSDAHFSKLPILAMTAHAMSGDREQSLEAGMNDHITKPIDPPSLYNSLAKWIRREGNP